MNAKSSSRKGAGKKTPEPGSVVLKLRERVFVYRNLRETIFPERATAAGLANAKERLEEALQAACIEKGYELKPFTVPFETLLLGDQEKPPVLQDYTLPANAGSRWKEAAWYFICGGNMVVALNAEDHLTVMALEEKNGPAFEGAYKRATELAAAVGKRVPFARSPEFGYLSSNPEHAGTGLFFSVDICLAGMGLLRTLEPALRALERLGFNVYPAFGRDAIPDGLFSYPRHLPPDGCVRGEDHPGQTESFLFRRARPVGGDAPGAGRIHEGRRNRNPSAGPVHGSRGRRCFGLPEANEEEKKPWSLKRICRKFLRNLPTPEKIHF